MDAVAVFKMLYSQIQPLLCSLLRTALWPIVYSRGKLFPPALFSGPPLASSVCVRRRGERPRGAIYNLGPWACASRDKWKLRTAKGKTIFYFRSQY